MDLQERLNSRRYEIIESHLDHDSGMVVEVFQNTQGYAVRMRFMDSDEPTPTPIYIYPTLEQAQAKAIEIMPNEEE